MIVALFDSDGTLYSAQFGRGLLSYAKTHARRSQARLYYASLVPELLLSKLSASGKDHFERAMIARLGWLIKGWDLQQGEAAFQWLVFDYLLATSHSPVLKRLQHHQSQGHLILIVSGMFTPALAMIGSHLGVADWVGTQIEVSGGRYTGRIIPPVIKGVDKVKHTLAYLSERNLDIDWPASYAYGDTFSDRDLLQLAGHPVAVYPDDRLRQLAQDKQWDIISK